MWVRTWVSILELSLEEQCELHACATKTPHCSSNGSSNIETYVRNHIVALRESHNFNDMKFIVGAAMVIVVVTVVVVVVVVLIKLVAEGIWPLSVAVTVHICPAW